MILLRKWTLFYEELYNDDDKRADYIEYLCDLTGCAGMGTFYFKTRRSGGIVPKEFNGRTVEEIIRQGEEARAAEPKCPTCGSTNIHKISFGERAILFKTHDYINSAYSIVKL